MADMEGIAGVTKWDETTGGQPLHAERARLYTEEINAAVRGAYTGGATEVVVMDCHGAGEGWTFNSLIPDQLDPRCDFVVQQEWTEYTEFLEAGCDAALLVGMHAMAGTADGVPQPHGFRHRLAQRDVQRDARRRDRHQCRAVRHVGLPGADGDRRRRRPAGRRPRCSATA